MAYVTLDTHERIEMLEEARDALNQAISLIRDATEGTTLEDYAASYTIPTLKMAASSEHEYLGRQPGNIDDLIDELNGSDEDDD